MHAASSTLYDLYLCMQEAGLGQTQQTGNIAEHIKHANIEQVERVEMATLRALACPIQAELHVQTRAV